MPKPRNDTPTRQGTIAARRQVVRILLRLAERRLLHGPNVAEVAERLLSERLREFVKQRKIPRRGIRRVLGQAGRNERLEFRF